MTVRFNIAELSEATGLNRRLIHDYIARELIRRPHGTGKAAYYDEEHYLRLRLVSLLKGMGLRLERIKEALDGWSLDEIRQIVDSAEGTDPESLSELHNWLAHGMVATSLQAFDRISPSYTRRHRTTRLGRLLTDNGLISDEALNAALEDQAASGERLGHYLVEKNLVQESDLVRLLSDQYGVPAADIDELDVPSSLLEMVPAEMARRYLVVPVQVNNKVLEVAMVDPTDVVAMDDLKFATGLRVQPMVASERAVREAIERLYGAADDSHISQMMSDLNDELNAPSQLEIADTDENIDVQALSQESCEAPDIKLVNLILTHALQRGAAEIHIEPYEKRLRVSYRIDGELYEIMDPPKSMQDALTSRIKTMSQLDTSERGRPQDGRVKLRVQLEGDLREVDVRVWSLPTIWGERIMIEFLAVTSANALKAEWRRTEKPLRNLTPEQMRALWARSMWQGRPSIERWIRLSLSPDVELSYRESDDPLLAKKVEQLRECAEEIFEVHTRPVSSQWIRYWNETLEQAQKYRTTNRKAGRSKQERQE